MRKLREALRRRPEPTVAESPAAAGDRLALLESALSGYLPGASFEHAREGGSPSLAVRVPGYPVWALTPSPGIDRLGDGEPPKRRAQRLPRVA